MRISDWSSDVCSSDLAIHVAPQPQLEHQQLPYLCRIIPAAGHMPVDQLRHERGPDPAACAGAFIKQNRAHLCLHVGIVLQPDCDRRSEEHTSELQSLMRISYAVFCLKKKNNQINQENTLKVNQLQ